MENKFNSKTNYVLLFILVAMATLWINKLYILVDLPIWDESKHVLNALGKFTYDFNKPYTWFLKLISIFSGDNFNSLLKTSFIANHIVWSISVLAFFLLVANNLFVGMLAFGFTLFDPSFIASHRYLHYWAFSLLLILLTFFKLKKIKNKYFKFIWLLMGVIRAEFLLAFVYQLFIEDKDEFKVKIKRFGILLFGLVLLIHLINPYDFRSNFLTRFSFVSIFESMKYHFLVFMSGWKLYLFSFIPFFIFLFLFVVFGIYQKQIKIQFKIKNLFENNFYIRPLFPLVCAYFFVNPLRDYQPVYILTFFWLLSYLIHFHTSRRINIIVVLGFVFSFLFSLYQGPAYYESFYSHAGIDTSRPNFKFRDTIENEVLLKSSKTMIVYSDFMGFDQWFRDPNRIKLVVVSDVGLSFNLSSCGQNKFDILFFSERKSTNSELIMKNCLENSINLYQKLVSQRGTSLYFIRP